MRGDALNGRLLGRIRNGLELTVIYPDVRPAPTGTSPTSAPVNVLTGTRHQTAVYDPTPSPAKPPVTIKCLWYAAYGSVSGAAGRDRHHITSVGWQEGADVMAQVEIATAALDPTDYRGNTIFTGCHRVVKDGHHYNVLSVIPVGPGHRDPVVYYVWLSGASKQ